MKKIVLITVSYLFLLNFLTAQCIPNNPVPPAVNNCLNAPLLCGGIDQYCSTLPIENIPREFPGCPNSILNNTHIVSFVAGSSFLELVITPSNCVNPTGDQLLGIQAALYADCDASVILAVSCNSPDVAASSLTTFTVPGETYFLFIDGLGASVCDYEIEVVEGTTEAPSLTGIIPSLNGPDYILNNNTYEFSVDLLPGVVDYNWSVTGGEVISMNENTASILVIDEENFEVCVEVANDCSQSETTCQEIGVNPFFEVIETTICEGDCFEFNNTLFCEEGTYEVEVDNGNETDLYLIIITLSNVIEVTVSEHVCFGECYTFDNEDYCIGGVYTATFISNSGCDSIVTLELTVLGENEPIVVATNDGDLDCQNVSTILHASSSFPDVTYLWSGPGITAANQNQQDPEVEIGGIYTVIVTTSSGCFNSASTIVLGEPEAPEVTIEGNDPFNCNNDENTIIVSGVISGLDYEWTGPGGFQENGHEVTVTEVGEYTLIVTTPSGCMDTIIVDVEENNDPLFVDPGPNRHIQCEFILTLDAPGAMGTNMFYEWSTIDGNILNGVNTLTPVVNSDGTYTLTATDLSNGCTGSAEMVVYADMAIINGSYSEINCLNSTVQIDASDSYDGSDATFQWSTFNGNILSGENTLTPTVDAGGVYQLLISRPGCLSFATATVIDNTAPPAIQISASASAIFCGTPVILNASSNANPVIYTWFLNGVVISTEASYTAIDPGEYFVEVVNLSSGCVNTNSIVLNTVQDPESVFIDGDLTLDCTLNGIGQLSAEAFGADPAYDFIWTTSGGEIITGNGTDIITILGGGTYCVEAFNLNTGCSVITCVDVEEVSDIILDPTVTNPSCESSNDGSIEIIVSGGSTPYSFEWNGPEDVPNAASIFDLEPGDYSLTVTDNIGCQAFQTFMIEAGDNEDVTADAGLDQSLDCLTDFLVLDGGGSVFSPGATFQWVTADGEIDDGANTLFPTVTSTGTYLLIIISPEGCQDTNEVVVTDYVADAGPSQTLDCNNPSVALAGGNGQAGATYDWTTADGNIVTGGNTLNPVVNGVGTYTLLVTNVNGCTYSDETTVDSDFENPDASVVNTEVFLVNCNEAVLIEGQSATPNVIYTWSGPSGMSNDAEFSVEQEGTYILTVTAANGCTSIATAQVIDQTVPPSIQVNNPTQYLNCFNGNPLLLDLSIQTNSSDIVVEWSSLNGNIVEVVGNSIKVDVAGTYQITVLDNGNNCMTENTIVVEEEDAVIEVETTIANCGIPDATATVNTTYIHNPEFIWSTGETTASIADLAPETYSVTITSPESTCDEIRIVEIVQDPSCFVIISGYIYDDEDLTCDLNGTIEPKEGVLVTITPEELETTTDADGYYEFLVPPGDYVVEPQLVSPYVVECPSESIIVSVPAGSSGSEGNNFFVKALSGFDLYVTATVGVPNAGSNQFHQINYCNNAFTTIFGTIEFTHDPLLVFDPVAAGAASYDPDTYTAVWEFEDLSFFECEFFNFSVFVPEDIPDGTEVISTITILPTQGDIAPENNSITLIRRVNNNGNTNITSPESEQVENHINQEITNAGVSRVSQYPNPFSNQTNIEFVLEIDEEIEIEFFDANGRIIKSFTGFEKGFNRLEVGGNVFPAKGIYFYKIVGPTVFATGRMIRH